VHSREDWQRGEIDLSISETNFEKPTIARQSWVFCWPWKAKQMKTQTIIRKLPARFGPETRFEVRPRPAVPFRAVQETEFDRLKQLLLDQLLAQAEDPELYAPLRRAANDAAALAWTTPYPALVLPELLKEKVREARVRARRQRDIRVRSRLLLGLPA
jgi:hypothetical protein